MDWKTLEEYGDQAARDAKNTLSSEESQRLALIAAVYYVGAEVCRLLSDLLEKD